MAKNYEIRFRTTSEVTLLVVKLWREHFFKLKRSGFSENIFLLGLAEIKKQIAKENERKRIKS